MKWIGQNIYDQISRFRNDTYFEKDVYFQGDTVTFTSANADDPIVTIKNTSNAANDMASLNFVKERDGGTAATGDNLAEIYFSGKDASGNTQEYGRILSEIDVATHGQESGRLKLGVANHDGGNGYGLTMQGGSVNDEVDVTVGLGASSVVTIPGNIDVAGNVTTGVWQGTAIASAYIADDAVTFAKALGVTSNVFDNKIKLIPSDFMANDDGGNTKFGVGYVESAGSLYGMRTANNSTELYAFVSIPQGMTATHVDIFDKNDLAVEVFEAQINATTLVSKGSGNANTTLDITDVASTATNFLVIEVATTSATNDKVYGGTVTIA